MSFKTASAILRGKWLIDKQWANQHLPMILNIINGKEAAIEDKRPEAYSAWSTPEDQSAPLPAQPEANQKKVAVISIAGPIMKYGDMCTYGATDYAGMVARADADSKVSAIVISMDSPGGMVDGTQTLADAIKNCTKPTFGIINDGIAASAGYWILSGCDQVYATHDTCEAGSIGVFATLYDFKDFFEAAGVKVLEIYAPQSTEKNREYREAIAGNEKLLKEDLAQVCDTFISYVKTNRGDRLNTKKNDPFKGGCFKAADAISIGLIDGKASFNEVLQMAIKSTTKNSSKMFGNKLSKISALKGKSPKDITAAEMDAANSQLTEEGIEGVTLVNDAELEAALTSNTNLTTEVSTLKSTVTSITADRDAWKAKAEAFGSQPGATPTVVTSTEPDLKAEGEPAVKTAQQIIDELPHNKAIANNPLFNKQPSPAK